MRDAIRRRWMFAWAWTISAVLLTGCAIAPKTAPPFQQPAAPAHATLAVVVTDGGTPEGEVRVTLHTGENGLTNADGYIAFPGIITGPRHITADLGECHGEIDANPFTANQQLTIALICPRPPPPPAPDLIVTARPLVGPLRVEAKLFRDDTGNRRVLFCSWFTALRVLRENPTEFYRQLDAIAAAGYQGARVFLAVGGWSDYWDNHEVAPIAFQKWFYTGSLSRTDRLGSNVAAWPGYDDTLRTLLRAFKARKLRLDVTVGDMQILVGNDQAKELDLARRLSHIAADEGGLEVIALVEGTNEFPINRYGGDGDASIEQLGRVLDIWRQAIPGVLTAEGAILSEEPDKLEAGARYGQVEAVHVTRDPIVMAIKRTAGLIFWEGNYRGFSKPFWHTEPAGPGRDSFAAQNDPANLTALYSMQALTGTAANYFNGPAVRGDGPLESTWGFTELPKILAQLPENVATWTHDSNRRGGVMYWFQGTTFATATYKDWDPSPPRPIAEWTLYAGDQVTHGTGTPPKSTGLIVGRFQ